MLICCAGCTRSCQAPKQKRRKSWKGRTIPVPHSLEGSSEQGRHSPTRAGRVGGPWPHMHAVPSSSLQQDLLRLLSKKTWSCLHLRCVVVSPLCAFVCIPRKVRRGARRLEWASRAHWCTGRRLRPLLQRVSHTHNERATDSHASWYRT